MNTAQLRAGTIEYTDIGEGRPLVFVHGILAGPELWEPVAERLSAGFRCILPRWPLGTHAHPMAADADQSPAGVAALIAEFLDALDLEDVVLVGNDSGGALSQLVAADHADRIGALVLTNCDGLDVFPPKLFAYLRWATHVPGAYTLLALSVRWLPFLRRTPIAWGWLSATDQREVVAGWAKAFAADRRVRRDVAAFARGVRPEVTEGAAVRLTASSRPTLLVWGADDRLFTPELAERLAAALPDARLEMVDGAKTFVSLDRPDEVAARIERFLDSAQLSRTPNALSQR